jgi:hypothetical protein
MIDGRQSEIRPATFDVRYAPGQIQAIQSLPCRTLTSELAKLGCSLMAGPA